MPMMMMVMTMKQQSTHSFSQRRVVFFPVTVYQWHLAEPISRYTHYKCSSFNNIA